MDGCEVGFVSKNKIEKMLTFHRSNLEDAEVKKEYERGYKLLLDFFHQHV